MGEKYYDNEISNIEYQVAQETQECNLVAQLKPKFGTDGDQFFFLLGEDVQSGVAGFGDTPRMAAINFTHNWYNLKAKRQGDNVQQEGK